MRSFLSWQTPTSDGAITVHDARSTALQKGDLVEVTRGASNEVYKVTETYERSFTCALVANVN
jgi:hypothetical protein